MFRLVLTRMLVLYITIILIVMMGQTFLLGKIYELEYIEQQKTAIQSQAEELATLVPTAQLAFDLNVFADSILTRSMEFTAQRYDATVWLVQSSGSYISLSLSDGPDGKPDRSAAVVTQGEMTEKEYATYLAPMLEYTIDDASAAPSASVTEIGSFNGRFSSETLSVGHSIVGVENRINGAVFIHSRMRYISTVVKGVYRQIAFSSLAALVVGMVLVAWTSAMFTRPLKQMSRISKEIAKGNFDLRADVVSNDEIGLLADSFNKMAEELKKQESLRRGFVANVSHELRSPMTSIQGFAQGMLDGTIPPEEHKKYLGIIVGETRRLNKLIRELLDLSQIESGEFPLNMQTFDINERIRLALIRFEDPIEEKHVEIEVDFRPDPAFVYADPDRIEQVIINLIDNAVKYTPEGGKISIWSHGGADRVLVGVRDNGPGIPAEDQPNIWERFYKVDKSHTGKKGTGLGLSIVKRIIDQHGERITLKSAPGEGSTFVFSLQTASASQKKALQGGGERGQAE